MIAVILSSSTALCNGIGHIDGVDGTQVSIEEEAKKEREGILERRKIMVVEEGKGVTHSTQLLLQRNQTSAIKKGLV